MVWGRGPDLNLVAEYWFSIVTLIASSPGDLVLGLDLEYTRYGPMLVVLDGKWGRSRWRELLVDLVN